MFRKGDVVVILPEFQDAGDADFVWVVIEDEDMGRVDIQPQGTGMSMPPRYTVTASQITLADRSSDAAPI